MKLVREHAIPLLSSGDFGESDSVVAIWNENSGVLEAMYKLALPDPADPKHRKGFWVALPEMPGDLKLDGPVRIILRVTGMLPEYRLWVRFGNETLVCFRTTLADVRGMVTTPLRASHEEIVSKAQTMIAELPAGYIEPGARALALRMEAFPTAENGVAPPTAAWVSDIAILPKP
jgi:hypothetical protein